jgi:tRNA 2-selenouridine synthase
MPIPLASAASVGAQGIPASEFLSPSSHLGQIVDVRSPSEFALGSIPTAVNLPLFTDAERHAVGLCYAREGREKAIRLGLEAAGPKLPVLAARLAEIVGAHTRSTPRPLRIHCWRGGMRSGAVAWLAGSLLGLPCVTLAGGYKAARGFFGEVFAGGGGNGGPPPPLALLGGSTGSGKSAVLAALREAGEHVLDLEGEARHAGSAFGPLARAFRQPSSPDAAPYAQPTQENFENALALQLLAFEEKERAAAAGSSHSIPPSSSSSSSPHRRRRRPVWLEDESSPVGRCAIPNALLDRMLRAPLVYMDVPRPTRLARSVEEYAGASPEALVEAATRLQKRIGAERTALVVAAIRAGDLARAADDVLTYYDSTYGFSLRRKGKRYVTVRGGWGGEGEGPQTARQWAEAVLKAYDDNGEANDAAAAGPLLR